MKKWIIACGIALLATFGQDALAQQPAQNGAQKTAVKEQYYGDKITSDGAKPVSQLKKLMGNKKELHVKLVGPVVAVCQKKGCWMDLKNGNESIRVTFKDYAFFMPKNAAGSEAIVDGVAKVEETSVADLKEYAKDAGKSQKEIDAIKEPKRELVFEANGVILR